MRAAGRSLTQPARCDVREALATQLLLLMFDECLRLGRWPLERPDHATTDLRRATRTISRVQRLLQACAASTCEVGQVRPAMIRVKPRGEVLLRALLWRQTRILQYKATAADLDTPQLWVLLDARIRGQSVLTVGDAASSLAM